MLDVPMRIFNRVFTYKYRVSPAIDMLDTNVTDMTYRTRR